MSFDLLKARGYGSGDLGDVTNPTAQINSYAKITARSTSTVTIDRANASIGRVDFVAGSEILLHVSGIKSGGDPNNIGQYKVAKIKSVNDNQLVLSEQGLFVTVDNYFYQAITVPNYNNLTISNTISPPAFDEAKGYGGVLALKCATKLLLTGKINLVNKGLTTAAYRPLLDIETNGKLDVDKYSGYENYDAAKHLALNVDMGAALIIAKEVEFGDDARIGNPNAKGIQRARGASDSLNFPTANQSNIGGASIVLIAETISEFNPAVISKYRTINLDEGVGLARAYIATESALPFDEGLYALDVINTPERLRKQTFINGFGSGVLGKAKPTVVQNNYAKITKIGNDGKTFKISNITTDGVAKFESKALVMIHASWKSNGPYNHVGRFFIANVVGTTSNTITLDHSIKDLNLSNFDLDHYLFQAITIPQYSEFTLSAINAKAPKWDGRQGGIFAIAVNGTCDLRGGEIDMRSKGGNKCSLDYTSNSQLKNRLPIGAGHGSVFILAKTLQVNSSTRLGGTHSGKSFGGNGGVLANGGGYMGKRNSSYKYNGYGGSGLKGGIQTFNHSGGYCSNASDGTSQGASIFIVADTIDGLSLDCLSTGGAGGVTGKAVTSTGYGDAGGCGYGGGGATNSTRRGGGGGVQGGGGGASDADNDDWTAGGGSAGFCFIYANNVTNQDTTYL